MGGLVTTKGAGMSVPDWPNSYGYNMFLFPPSRWLGGIFYEHTHRLLGTLSGFLAIGLTLLAWGPGRSKQSRRRWIGWMSVLTFVGFAASAILFKVMEPEDSSGTLLKTLLPHFGVGFVSMAAVTIAGLFCKVREGRRWVRWLVIGELTAVCAQGVLGGMRVDLVNVELAIVHGCFAQLFLCLSAFTALATSRWWIKTLDRSRLAEAHRGRVAMMLAGVCSVVIFCQLVIGAIMRHSGAGLAIPDLPLAFGKLLPPMNATQLAAANEMRSWRYHLPPVSLAQVWMHFAHRFGALVVTAAVAVFAIYVFQKIPRGRAIRKVAGILAVLVVVQVTLGVLTVLLRKPADIASMHVATGALTLMTATLGISVAARAYSRQRSVAAVRSAESLETATVHA